MLLTANENHIVVIHVEMFCNVDMWSTKCSSLGQKWAGGLCVLCWLFPVISDTELALNRVSYPIFYIRSKVIVIVRTYSRWVLQTNYCLCMCYISICSKFVVLTRLFHRIASLLWCSLTSKCVIFSYFNVSASIIFCIERMCTQCITDLTVFDFFFVMFHFVKGIL